MSKYRTQYTDSKGRTSNIEDLPDGHLHNAAKKLERVLAEKASEGDPIQLADQIRLEELKKEIAERAAKAETEARGGQP